MKINSLFRNLQSENTVTSSHCDCSTDDGNGRRDTIRPLWFCAKDGISRVPLYADLQRNFPKGLANFHCISTFPFFSLKFHSISRAFTMQTLTNVTNVSQLRVEIPSRKRKQADADEEAKQPPKSQKIGPAAEENVWLICEYTVHNGTGECVRVRFFLSASRLACLERQCFASSIARTIAKAVACTRASAKTRVRFPPAAACPASATARRARRMLRRRRRTVPTRRLVRADRRRRPAR